MSDLETEICISVVKANKITENLLKWAERNFRDYSWRNNPTPFSILIVEVLLRRTTATAVQRIYPSFIKKYGSLPQIVNAKEADLESSLSSIGYQRKRAKILKEIATFLVTEFQGIVPEKREDLLKIPHVGSYIASAVLSLGFDHAYAMVDTNVIRIYSRIFLSSLPKKRKIDSSKKLQPFAYLKKAIRNSILPYWTLRL